MNISIISPTCYPPIARGLEIHVRNLSQELAKRGHSVHLISSNIDREGVFPNILEHRVRSIRNEYLNSFHFSIMVFITIIRINKVDKIDIYHFHGPPYLRFLGEILCLLTRKKIVYTIHGSFTPSRRIKFLLSMLGHKVRIIAVSENIKRLMESECSINNITIIPTGIHLADFENIGSEERNGNTILFVGALTEDKGVKYLIECMEKVFRSNQNVKLVIAGDGPLKEALIDLSKTIEKSQNIVFKGQVRHDEIPSLLARATLLVLPSIQTRDSIEGTPTILLEAMAAGLPIVASKVGGISEIVKDGVNGILVPEKDCDNLADAINHLLSDSNMLFRYRENNLDACKEYDWNLIIKKIIDVYATDGCPKYS